MSLWDRHAGVENIYLLSTMAFRPHFFTLHVLILSLGLGTEGRRAIGVRMSAHGCLVIVMGMCRRRPMSWIVVVRHRKTVIWRPVRPIMRMVGRATSMIKRIVLGRVMLSFAAGGDAQGPSGRINIIIGRTVGTRSAATAGIVGRLGRV